MLVNEQTETSQADSQILHPGSRALFRFWESMRAEDAAPRRSALDLKPIRDLVSNLMIIEHEPHSGGFRWRLAGTMICDLYRREVTGKNVLLGWDSFEADVVGRFLGGVVHNLQPCLLRFRMRTDLGQTIGAELIGLPLQSGDGASIQVFGGIFPFRDTQSLGYRGISSLELSGARSIWTEHLPGDLLVRQLGETARRPFRPFQVIRGGRSASTPGGGL